MKARLLPAALIAFGLLPILANALRRIAQTAGAGGSATAEAGGLSLPVLVHVVAATVFVVLGALQLSAGMRRRRPAWHRRAGRVAAAAAVLAAVSGIWLAFEGLSRSGGLLFTFRLLAASAMALFIVLGIVAIRRRRLPQHRAWMIRAYAIGLGAATQVFTLGLGQELFGRGELAVALLNGAGWAINLAVAEWAIRRTGGKVGRSAVVAAAEARR